MRAVATPQHPPLLRAQPRRAAPTAVMKRAPARRTTMLALAILAVLIPLIGCGSGRTATSASDAAVAGGVAGAEPAQGAPTELDGTRSDSGAFNAAGTGVLADAATATERSVIRTGQITVEVKDLANATGAVRAQAIALGGFVANESTGLSIAASADENGKLMADAGQSVLVIRVPEAQFQTAFTQVAGVGKELARSSSAQDVTGEVADLTSRTATAKQSVERIRQLLASAKSITDIVTLESELTRRQSDLEALQARLAATSGQATLATLTVMLQTPSSAATVQDDDNALVRGLKAGWSAMVESASALLVILGALVPFAIVLGLIGWMALLINRRLRRPKSHATTSAQGRANADSASAHPSRERVPAATAAAPGEDTDPTV